MTDHTCSVEGCDAPIFVKLRGLCRTHYHRWYRYGDPVINRSPIRGICSVVDCDRPHHARGWCSVHYRRWRRYGDHEHLERVRNSGTAEERWWARVDLSTECWFWDGYRDHNGYGGFGDERGRLVKAHRWGYERFVQPVTDDLVLDHLCRNPACVRFDHLEPVTHTENVRRGVTAIRGGDMPQRIRMLATSAPYSGDNPA